MLQAAGWPRRLRGQIFAPSLPTCGDRCYDKFLVDARLAHMIAGVQAISDAGGKPHRVSRLLLDGTLARGMIRQLVRPRPIPTALPPTAAPRPQDYSTVMATRTCATSIAAAATAWHAAAETEFTHLRGVDARAGDAYCGRAQTASFKWVPASCIPTFPELGATALSMAWRAVAGWCLVLGQPPPLCPHAMASRRATVQAALRSLQRAASRRLPEGDDAMDFRTFVLDLTPAVIATPRCMLHAYRAATRIAKRLEKARSQAVQSSWCRSLCRGAQLTRQAYHTARPAIGYTPAPIGDCPPDDDSVIAEPNPDPEDPVSAVLPVVRGMCIRTADHSRLSTSPASRVPLGLQAATDQEAESWAALWAEGADYVAPTYDLRQVDHPGAIRLSMLRAACCTFPQETGLGMDAVQPRALLRLSDEALQALCVLLMAIELHGTWPELVRLVLIVLLPKPDGGRRPIGLLPTLVRVWMRVRGPIIRKWREALARDDVYGGPGKGAQRAAWMQAARAELAHMRSRCYGVVLVDLVKAFERVPHHLVAQAAHRRCYSSWILRLSLDAYRMARAVVIDGSCSRLVVATRGITAGSGFATEELCCLMLDVLDDIRSIAPGAVRTLYVDDATLEAAGSQRSVAATLRSATRVLADGVEAAGLEVSVQKSVVLSSHPSLARKIARTRGHNGKRPLHSADRAKMLGCGTAGGRRRAIHVQQHRLKHARDCLPRVQRLRRAGVPTARWQRTAGNPALQYGADTIGVADSVLHRQCTLAAGMVSAPGAGKQLDAVLWLADAAGHTTDTAFPPTKTRQRRSRVLFGMGGCLSAKSSMGCDGPCNVRLSQLPRRGDALLGLSPLQSLPSTGSGGRMMITSFSSTIPGRSLISPPTLRRPYSLPSATVCGAGVTVAWPHSSQDWIRGTMGWLSPVS